MFFFIKGNAIVLCFTYIVSQNGWLSLIVLCIIFIRLRLWAGMCWFSHSPCRGAIHDGLWLSQQWVCLRGWLDYRLKEIKVITDWQFHIIHFWFQTPESPTLEVTGSHSHTPSLAASVVTNRTLSDSDSSDDEGDNSQINRSPVVVPDLMMDAMEDPMTSSIYPGLSHTDYQISRGRGFADRRRDNKSTSPQHQYLKWY